VLKLFSFMQSHLSILSLICRVISVLFIKLLNYVYVAQGVPYFFLY
jgi:hypothetical protein